MKKVGRAGNKKKAVRHKSAVDGFQRRVPAEVTPVTMAALCFGSVVVTQDAKEFRAALN